jgi:hypothetical protein
LSYIIVKLFGLTVLFFLSLALVGCSSYSARVEPGHDLTKYHEFFVKANFDDNHGIAGRIEGELRDRGFKATSGPLTMLPHSAQVIISYQDRWNWDFTNHLTGLTLRLSEARGDAPIAAATFDGPASMATSLDGAVDKVITKLFKARPAKTSSADTQAKELQR